MSRDLLQEWGGKNLFQFLANNSLNFIDSHGLKTYTAYRKLDIPVVEYLWLLHTTGHVYLAFHVDGEGLTEKERQDWCEFLNSKEIGFRKNAWPKRGEKQYHNWITFSFHPKHVDPKTGDSEGDLLSVFITESSFVDLNNTIKDINPVIDGRATKNLITSNFDEEKKLFRRALKSLRAQGQDYGGYFKTNFNDFTGGYGFLRRNCGGWSKYITTESGLTWPLTNRFYNLGVGVDGPLEYPAEVIDTLVRIGYIFLKDARFKPQKNIDYSPNNDRNKNGIEIEIPLW